MYRLFILLPFLSMLAGCSWREFVTGAPKPQISYVKLTGSDKEPVDKIYVWNPDTSAAYIYPTNNSQINAANGDSVTAYIVNYSAGKACIYGADVFKTIDSEFDSSATIKAINDIDGLDASTKGKLIENVTKISEKDEAAAYLSVAMFNLCMIGANQNIKDDQMAELIEVALEQARIVAETKAAVKIAEAEADKAKAEADKAKAEAEKAKAEDQK